MYSGKAELLVNGDKQYGRERILLYRKSTSFVGGVLNQHILQDVLLLFFVPTAIAHIGSTLSIHS